MSSNRHDWRRRTEKHAGLAATAKQLEEERTRLEDAQAVVESAENNIEYLLERYRKQLDETAFIELPEGA